MFNICLKCKKKFMDPEIIFVEDSFVIICPNCGNETEFKKHPLYLILGASGTGKSAICQKIISRFKDYIIMDVDTFWRREFDQPETNFIDFKNYCLKIAKNLSQNGLPVLFFLQGIPEEFENSSERKFFTTIHYLFLVCDDEELARRLRMKFPEGEFTEQREQFEKIIHYNRKLKEIAQLSDSMLIDTSRFSLDDTIIQIYNWLKSRS
ncbi:MAG: AAA family ATPase [Candidatus Heimdallarchaeota archaeon]|nr:AAA family ATPase [Candidatus Heimdallarchaeota archaeon]